MSKDPAFLFYTNDFLTGVAELTMQERGEYITLMCLQHQKGGLTQKIIDINTPGVSKDVMVKFKKKANGIFFNQRLEKEIIKRKKYSKKQSDRAKKRWNTTADATANATALPKIEDVNENESKDDNDNVSTKEQFMLFKTQISKKDHVEWREHIYMLFKLKPQTLEPLLGKFINHLIIEETEHKLIKDFKTHFRNWCTIIETKGKLNQYKKQHEVIDTSNRL